MRRPRQSRRTSEGLRRGRGLCTLNAVGHGADAICYIRVVTMDDVDKG